MVFTFPCGRVLHLSIENVDRVPLSVVAFRTFNKKHLRGNGGKVVRVKCSVMAALGLTAFLLASLLVAPGSPVRTNKNSASHGSGGKKKNAGNQPKKCVVDSPFDIGCTAPFKNDAGTNISVKRDIDDHCPLAGCPDSRAEDQEQDRQKNNLCADATKPVIIDFKTIDLLQGDVAGLSTGRPPADRSGLRRLSTKDSSGKSIKLGEGDVVTLEAFVLHAKHDDVPLLRPNYHGEGVNCRNDSTDWNDIHIALGQTASDHECDSVTAEIIPHFRPANWDRFDNDPKTMPHVKGIAKVKGLQVRITGQLFFDGSHRPKPCSNMSKSTDPPRRALWEIHPVYDIKVKVGSGWTSFDDWANSQH